MAPGGQVGDGRRGAVYGGDVSAVGQKGPAQQTQAAPGVAHPVLRVQERPQLPGQVRIVAAAVRRRVQIADDLRTPSLHGSPPFFLTFYHTIPPPGMQAGGRMMGNFKYVLQFYGRNIRNAIEFGSGGRTRPSASAAWLPVLGSKKPAAGSGPRQDFDGIICGGGRPAWRPCSGSAPTACCRTRT